jgi:L-alanine-DL-glutamate epimerase-like enolase superfamily enzyme
MRVVSVEAKPVSVPVKLTDPPQVWTKEWSNQMLVLARTDEGLVGIGDVFLNAADHSPYSGYLNSIKELVIGEDPFNLNKVSDVLQKVSYTSGRGGITSAVISGVDIALHDVVAKQLGIPLYKFLGGKRKEGVKAYASLARYKSCQDVVKVVRYSLDRGFKAVKLHQGGKDVVECAREVREIGYDFELMADLNCSLNLKQALRVLPRLERYELEWVEEPLWPPEDYRSLRELSLKLGIPIAAGENEYTLSGFMRLVREGGVSIVQPDLAKVGGFTQMRKITALTEALGAQLIPHCRPQSLWVTILATAHFAVTLASDTMLEVSPTPPYQEPFVEPLRFEKGVFYPTESPGLGVKDQGWFDLFPPTQGRLPRFADLE